MPNYPERLPQHETFVFNLEHNEYNLYDHLAYFFTDQYPLPMHMHDFYELNIVISGTGRHYIENNSLPIEPGDVFVIPPHISHGYWSQNEHMSIFHLLIDEDLLIKHYADLLQFDSYFMMFYNEPMYRQNPNLPKLFLRLSPETQESILPKLLELTNIAIHYNTLPRAMFDTHTISLLCDLMSLMNKSIQNPTGAGVVTTLMQVISYFEKNMMHNITVEELSQKAYMSPQTFIRQIKKYFNMTPAKFFIKLRLNYAVNQLKYSSLPITQIAQNCGFFDSSHFSNCFVKEIGITPSQYRKQHQRGVSPQRLLDYSEQQ